MEKLTRALKFLRVTDADGDISLTNIALVAVLVRLLAAPEIEIADLVSFLVTIGGYHFKRWMAPEPQAPESEVAELKKAIEALQSKVAAAQLGKALGK